MNKAIRRAFNQSHGFTLVEVMVALIIVAVTVSSLLFQIMSTINSTAYLRMQTVAHWVALNQLELVYLENSKSNRLITDQRSGTEKMAGKQWFWRIKPIKTENNNFLQVVVSVYSDEDDQESSIVSVTGLIDRYHRPL
ncbi:type II secretion system minor pseudopilin GspI [uncultured Oceanicoccus sp.]|uniref:type II secretion system minor pseudopilin GspI n=1 Tax=uncultured Oceanicoccus sp. TaxID=1706381 RepID=UPI0030DD095F